MSTLISLFQALKLMPQTLTYKDDVIVSFSVHNINLCERDGEY